jgi:hypothetical protein
MADYEIDLGTIFSLQQKILSELEDIKNRLDCPLPTLLWYDNLPSYTDMQKGRRFPQKNSSNRRNISVLDAETGVMHLLDGCGFDYEVKALDNWHDKHSNRNNLYFVEITQVHLGLDRFFEFIPEEALQLCREHKLAFVWYFPHEAFHFEGLRKPSTGRTGEHGDAGWFERFTDKFFEVDIDYGKHYFISGDLRVEDSWIEWSSTRPEKENLFKSVIGMDHFNYHYYEQYFQRTQLRFDPDTTLFPVENYETYGYVPEAKIKSVYIEPHILFNKFGDKIVTESEEDHEEHYINSQEVMRVAPTVLDKTKDLVCFNARTRPSRSVMVSELFRMGYNNDNSHISWLERDEDVRTSWRDKCFRSLVGVDGKDQWVKSNNAWGNLMSTQESKEYFYDFWEKTTDPIICDTTTAQIDMDDRIIPVEMFKESFFFLITETLFGNADKDCLQITEKTYKALAYRIPFIIVGSYGTLAHLRTLGYKTFSHMFDEAYDEILDPDQRMSAICNELSKWKNLSLEEKQEKYFLTIPDLTHNYYHWKNSCIRSTQEIRRHLDRLKLHD